MSSTKTYEMLIHKHNISIGLLLTSVSKAVRVGAGSNHLLRIWDRSPRELSNRSAGQLAARRPLLLAHPLR